MKWITLVPLIYSDLSDAFCVGMQWAGEVTLVRTPTWLVDVVAPKLSAWQRHRLQSECAYALQIEYEADSYGEIDSTWVQGNLSKQDVAQERARLVTLALWLEKPSSISFEIIVHADWPDGGQQWRFRNLTQASRIFPDPQDLKVSITYWDIQESYKHYEQIKKVPRESAVWTVLYVLWRALSERRQGELRILLYWIAMEALFGPKNEHKISHRIAERTAALLGSSHDEIFDYYNRVRDGYDVRSKIVHGFQLGQVEKAIGDAMMGEAKSLVWHSIRTILSEQDLLTGMTEEDREKTLQELVGRKLHGLQLRRRRKT